VWSSPTSWPVTVSPIRSIKQNASRSGQSKVGSATSRSSRWAVRELPSSEDLDPHPRTDAPRPTPSSAKSQVWAELTCDRDRALIKVATDCGARPSELLAMTGADIDWGDALVQVLRKGGARTQWLPVSRDAIIWLRR